MAPLLASLLIGVAVKVGVGLAATAAKKALDASNAKGAAAQAESFGSLLKTGGSRGAAGAADSPDRGVGVQSARAPGSVLSDLSGRLRSAERLHLLALDARGRQSLPSLSASGSRQANAGLDAYRRLAAAAS